MLKRSPIEFHSTSVSPNANGGFQVSGELELFGRTAPVSFALAAGSGRLTGTATINQTAGRTSSRAPFRKFVSAFRAARWKC